MLRPIAQRKRGHGYTGFGWVRTSTCVDDDNSIYLSSCDHHHKVVGMANG